MEYILFFTRKLNETLSQDLNKNDIHSKWLFTTAVLTALLNKKV